MRSLYSLANKSSASSFTIIIWVTDPGRVYNVVGCWTRVKIQRPEPNRREGGGIVDTDVRDTNFLTKNSIQPLLRRRSSIIRRRTAVVSNKDLRTITITAEDLHERPCADFIDRTQYIIIVIIIYGVYTANNTAERIIYVIIRIRVTKQYYNIVLLSGRERRGNGNMFFFFSYIYT